ncbi:MAG: hypothetical protein ACXWQR_14175 [Ktedonobacterales bacterium]
MREYLITIETSQGNTIQKILFGVDRNDMVEFVKRTHRARFLRKEYKSLASVRLNKVTDKMVLGD